MKPKELTLVVIYVAMTVFTTGHAANNLKFSNDTMRSPDSIFAGILWPFYWSWELQRKEQQP